MSNYDNLNIGKNTNSHAETIAQTLLTVEYCVFWIGIPLLKPNRKRYKLSKSFFYPLDDFIKCSLVSVPTAELQIAIENFEVDAGVNGKNDLDELISLPLHDRLYFPALSILVIFAITACSIMPLTNSLQHALYAAIAASLGACIASFMLIIDPVRRSSLRNILINELNRRKGVLGPGNKISIMKPTY